MLKNFQNKGRHPRNGIVVDKGIVNKDKGMMLIKGMNLIVSREGWICSRCGSSNSPDVQVCQCSVSQEQVTYNQWWLCCSCNAWYALLYSKSEAL